MTHRNIFDACYVLHLDDSRHIKSRRYNTVKSTGNYGPFERMARKSRDGIFYCYLYDAHENGPVYRDNGAVMQLVHNGYITGIFNYDVTCPDYAYGDMAGTEDALIFHFSLDRKIMVIFVAMNKKSVAKKIVSEIIAGKHGQDLNETVCKVREVKPRVLRMEGCRHEKK
ncbi:MAG: hypothetical protein LUC91_11220 [Prevotella sp.]|nr:hypothetical protein [Prevotella sp.]